MESPLHLKRDAACRCRSCRTWLIQLYVKLLSSSKNCFRSSGTCALIAEYTIWSPELIVHGGLYDFCLHGEWFAVCYDEKLNISYEHLKLGNILTENGPPDWIVGRAHKEKANADETGHITEAGQHCTTQSFTVGQSVDVERRNGHWLSGQVVEALASGGAGWIPTIVVRYRAGNHGFFDETFSLSSPRLALGGTRTGLLQQALVNRLPSKFNS